MSNVGRYSKFIVAVIGVATSILASYHGTSQVVPAVASALGALGVLLVPNQPPATPAAVPPPPPPGPPVGGTA